MSDFFRTVSLLSFTAIDSLHVPPFTLPETLLHVWGAQSALTLHFIADAGPGVAARAATAATIASEPTTIVFDFIIIPARGDEQVGPRLFYLARFVRKLFYESPFEYPLWAKEISDAEK